MIRTNLLDSAVVGSGHVSMEAAAAMMVTAKHLGLITR